MSHGLWWQHNSGLVFWPSVLDTYVRICSPVLDTCFSHNTIICRCKDCKTNTWWWFRLYLLPLYQCTQAIHISDLDLTDGIDVKSALRQMCCPKLCPGFLWSLINFIQVDGSPSYTSRTIVSDEIRQNPLEYMEVLIPDSRGSQHLLISAASVCRTMSHPLSWTQFFPSVLTTCFHLNTTVFNYLNHLQIQRW